MPSLQLRARFASNSERDTERLNAAAEPGVLTDASVTDRLKYSNCNENIMQRESMEVDVVIVEQVRQVCDCL